MSALNSITYGVCMLANFSYFNWVDESTKPISTECVIRFVVTAAKKAWQLFLDLSLFLVGNLQWYFDGISHLQATVYYILLGTIIIYSALELSYTVSIASTNSISFCALLLLIIF